MPRQRRDQQLDLFLPLRPRKARCPVCAGKGTVPFWSRQGKVPVIGGKSVRCESCAGSGRVPIAPESPGLW